MQMHRVALASFSEMCELELLTKIVEQEVLNHKNKVFVDGLEGLNLVVQLYQDGLCGHLPVHAVGFVRCLFFSDNIDSNISKIFLACWPNGTRCIQSLELTPTKSFTLSSLTEAR